MIVGKIVCRFFTKAITANSATVTQVAADTVAAAKKTVAATRKVARSKLDYGRKVFALNEGQVTTRTGKTYTRSMGENGERIYTDAEGNKITFNGLIFKEPGYNESGIFRSSPNGAYYSLRFSTGNLRFNRGVQKVHLWTRDKVGGNCKTARIEINPKGRVVETHFDYYNANGNPLLSGIRTRYGCPTAWEHTDVYGWLNWRGVTDAPPIWEALSNYVK